MNIFRKFVARLKQREANRYASKFLKDNEKRRLANPLIIDDVFLDNVSTGRLILLTSSKELHGRAFFVESLGVQVLHGIPDDLSKDDFVLCFGYNDFLKNAKMLYKLNVEKVFFIEAGFLRSILMDKSSSVFNRALCFFVDDLGFHYDPEQLSRIEVMLNDPELTLTDQDILRARKIRETIICNCLTKYNDQALSPLKWETTRRKRVLVVEQARNDWAILKSGGAAKSFRGMLEVAIAQNPDAEILVKVHPDTLNGKRGGIEKSYYGDLQDTGQIKLITEKINPITLMETVERVYVFTSMLGFEAAMMGKEVHVFGKPCYAGWGFTVDYQVFERRTRHRSVDEAVFIIYVLYQKYKNLDGMWCSAESTIETLLNLRNVYLKECKSISRTA
ncbi:hypothetical protein [Pseudovibrio sp. SCP19]|uniref:capsular polysaccharide export protein, LipB/KpsS family n=1 Tax=Pseudovibrio sp. SCP19 TaxID=3141374 RepID=UPI00333E174A